MVKGLPNLEEHLSSCKTCLFGKQIRLPFKTSTWRVTEKLQLIHIDVCGLQNSLNGNKYYIVFIDDLTKNVLDLYYEDQVRIFLEFKNWIENQSSCKTQVIR